MLDDEADFRAAAIHYAQVVDELMDRRGDWLEENEPEWLQHMVVARLHLLVHTGDVLIAAMAQEALEHMGR